jgi:hypothetical protein
MIIKSIEDNKDYDYTYEEDNQGLPSGITLCNDGATTIILTIGDIDVTINAGEIFEDSFKRFDSFSIDADDAYRCLVRR